MNSEPDGRPVEVRNRHPVPHMRRNEQIVACRHRTRRVFVLQQDFRRAGDDQDPLIPCLIEPFSGRSHLPGRHDPLDPDIPDLQQLIKALRVEPIRDVSEQAAAKKSAATRACCGGIPPLYASLFLSVHEREPATQLPRCLVRGLAVERHQCGAPSWRPLDLRAPFAPANARYLDEVLAAIDDLFKAMHVFFYPSEAVFESGGNDDGFYRVQDGVQAKRRPKAHQHGAPARFPSGFPSKKIFVLIESTGVPLFFHRFSTGRARMQHPAGLPLGELLAGSGASAPACHVGMRPWGPCATARRQLIR